MKKFLCLIISLMFLLFSSINIVCAKNTFAQDFVYTYEVEHLFFHCLIAYPEIALKPNNPLKKSYFTDCITPNEFNKILDYLYKNNFVLVSLFDTFYVKDGISSKAKIKVPHGKKALILSFDDVNYDSRKMGYGMVDKIILDGDNNIASQTIINGKKDISYSREFLPILENFVKNHPDFSPYGAKGTINLTGFDGVLGYRTSHTYSSLIKEQEIEKAKIVVKRLKEMGWTFACHSYGHYHMKKVSDEKFEEEIKKWKCEVEPIIKKTNAYVYPYGEWEIFCKDDYCNKHKMLMSAGFNIFLGVGMKTFYSYLPSNSGKKVLFMDRKVVDGTTLCSNNPYLKPFFDPTKVLDELRSKI